MGRIWLGLLGALVDLALRRQPTDEQLRRERQLALELVADDMIRRDQRRPISS